MAQYPEGLKYIFQDDIINKFKKLINSTNELSIFNYFFKKS